MSNNKIKKVVDSLYASCENINLTAGEAHQNLKKLVHLILFSVYILY